MKKRRRHRLWRIWAKAIGEKAGSDDREADAVKPHTHCYIFFLSTY